MKLSSACPCRNEMILYKITSIKTFISASVSNIHLDVNPTDRISRQQVRRGQSTGRRYLQPTGRGCRASRR
eukprot:749602-Hanusia_phi.AAC.2